MAYVITEPCIGVKDASCLDVCPVDCIYSTDADTMYFIHPDECIDCGACESVCPVSAIFPEDAVPDKWKSYTESSTRRVPLANGCLRARPLSNTHETLFRGAPFYAVEAACNVGANSGGRVLVTVNAMRLV